MNHGYVKPTIMVSFSLPVMGEGNHVRVLLEKVFLEPHVRRHLFCPKCYLSESDTRKCYHHFKTIKGLICMLSLAEQKDEGHLAP